MGISNKCMVVNIQIGLWLGYRLDKTASADVTARAEAMDDAARVNKHLISKSALQPIQTAGGAIRTHFKRDTLPWKDNGDRLLVRERYMAFIEKHGELKRKFNDEVDRFITQTYPAEVEKAEFRMGSLFNPDDYPTPEQLRRKFYVSLDIDPVSEAHDFRVQMDDEVVDEIKSSIEYEAGKRLARAMGDVWTRLNDCLQNYATRMGSDTKFKTATVDNLREIVELLPAYNITNDPNLEAIRQDIEATIATYTTEDIRQRPDVRSYVATEADRILQTMGGFMTAFEGDQ